MPNDPAWINADAGAPEYTARELRRLDAALMYPGSTDQFGARSGVRPGGADAVTLAGTTVTVHDLCAVVYTAAGGSQTGPYRVALQEETHGLDPADGSNDRIDAIDLQVQDDDEDASGQRRAHSVYVVGTPAGTPDPPTLSDNAIRLATVDVPAGGTPAPTLDYVAPFAVASGGILPMQDGETKPTDGVYEGAYVDQDEALWRRTSTSWLAVASPNSPAQVTFTSSGSFTKGNFLWGRKVMVEIWGAGGGGGGAGTTSSGEAAAAGGGGAGGYSRVWLDFSALSASEAITIGDGGGGGSAGANDGSAGGSSSFGTHCTANGGAGGAGRASVVNGIGQGGVAGGASGGDINLTGQQGDLGRVSNGELVQTSRGGSPPLGIGQGAYMPPATNGGNGNNAPQYAAGGSGGINASSQGTGRSGGNGSGGICIVTVY